MKVSKADLYKLDAVEIYKEVLKGDVIKRFPNGFWKRPDAYDNARKCTRYLFDVILKYNREDIVKNNSSALYKKYKLKGMLAICFNNSPYNAIDNAYKGVFKHWEFKSTPMGYWNRERGIEAVKWLILEKYKLSKEEVKEQLSVKLFVDNGLESMLKNCFSGSPYLAIESAFPGVFNAMDFSTVPHGYWTKERGIELTRWLIEEKLNLSDKELKNSLSVKLFVENGLGSMLTQCFNGSPYLAIDSVYPGVYREIDFNVPQGYWTRERAIECTRWLIKDKLKLSKEELKEQLSVNLFKENGLNSMLLQCFNGSPYLAIESAFPGVFKKSDFKNSNKYK